jgi:hypothetical protein
MKNHQTRVTSHPRLPANPPEPSAQTVWDQLQPCQRRQLAQQWAQLIQRLRHQVDQLEGSRDERS